MTRKPRLTSMVTYSVWALLASGIVTRAIPPQAVRDPTLPDVQKLGPQVGDRVPEFTLTDQWGQRRSLASLMGPNGIMLVFYRSADW